MWDHVFPENHVSEVTVERSGCVDASKGGTGGKRDCFQIFEGLSQNRECPSFELFQKTELGRS